jgi:protein-S-isoprenylcysteine O-methyltransferase Ste14
MYLGVTVILLGVAIWVGSLPMLIAPVGFFGIMSVFRIPDEEQRLREIFGATYEDYTRRVRRWI